jgi:DNA repair exonuclease SbcCD ATPase subunit
MTTLPAISGQLIEVDQGKIEKAFAAKDGLNDFLEKLKETAKGEQARLPDDMKVLKTRKAYKSLGAKVGKYRAALEKTAKALADHRRAEIQGVTAEISAINANKKQVSEFLKELRSEMVAPAVEWEEAEKKRKAEEKEKEEARIKDIHSRIELIKHYQVDNPSATVDILKGYLSDLLKIEIDESFEEFTDAANAAKQASIQSLEKSIELAELKEAERQRRQKERDEKIRQEAREQERKRQEEKLLQEKLDARNAEIKRKTAIRGNIQDIGKLVMGVDKADSQTIRARIDILLGYELTQDKFMEFLEEAQAEQARVKEILESSLKKAEAREKEQEELAEKQRKERQEKEAREALEREKKKKEDERKQREANAAHAKKIEDEAMDDMVAFKFDRAVAAKLLFHIKSGQIRNLSINY